jgi:prepilin-type N-terminal cleavage/methylation domain-containing protein
MRGARGRRAGAEAGLTIMEMLIVVAIVGLMAGITFPSVASGLESLRMRSAGDSVASFLTLAMARVERSQEPVELTFLRGEGRIEMRAADPKFARTLELPDGVSILHVHPELPGEPETTRSVLLLPATPFPRLGVELLNRRGSRRLIRIDPLSAVPVVEIPRESVSGEER